MITIDQALQYLDSVGASLPDFVLSALVDRVNSIQDCLDEHYDPGTALLIQTYVIGLLGLAQADRYVSSQSAPSGASRGFKFQSFTDRWRSLSNLIKTLDKYGCSTPLIPNDPNQVFHAGIWVSTGGVCDE